MVIVMRMALTGRGWRFQSRDIASDKSTVSFEFIGKVPGPEIGREARDIENTGNLVNNAPGQDDSEDWYEGEWGDFGLRASLTFGSPIRPRQVHDQ